MNIQWVRLGGRLGTGFVVGGFVLIFLGWNGAASVDRVPSQFPYLISGGLAGLCLVVLGAALMIVQTQREDRAQIDEGLREVREAIERMASASTSPNGHVAPPGSVLAGPTAYHRPECRLLDGRGELPSLTVTAALAANLTPCRTCKPAPSDDAAETREMPRVTAKKRAPAKRKPRARKR